MKKIFFSILCVLFVFSSCQKEIKNNSKTDDNYTECGGIPFDFSTGALVINEGSFQGSGKVFHYNLVTNAISKNLYLNANCDVPAGMFLQSAAIRQNRVYIVANGSGEIQVVDRNTFEYKKSIQLSYPRYMAFEQSRGFITNGTINGYVYVLDEHDKIVDSVSVASGPNPIIASNGKILVGSLGSWDNALFSTITDSAVTIINPSDLSKKELLAWSKPTDFVEDKNGKVWVGCSGNGQYDYGNDKPPAFVKIDVLNEIVEDTIIVGEAGNSISKIAINPEKDIIYYYKSDGVYRLGINGEYKNEDVFIPTTGLYGIEVDPKSGDVFVFDAVDYSSAGMIRRYDSSGNQVASVEVGVAPNGAVFYYN
tara:strand:- start:8097 stop:9194 length:1098 start_codon:yes stop_codon:yes gene_type:complete